MKRNYIFSFIILITLFFFSGLHAFGQCQTEQEAVDKAEEERDNAEKTVRNIKLDIAYILFFAPADNPEDNAERAEDLMEAYERLKEAEKVLEEKEEALKKAQNALDHCLAFAYRSCGCSVQHTQTLSSCSCDKKMWTGFCPCPARLPTT